MKVMANLLYGTCKPRVMDIKIGQRTFQEDEVSNQKTRMDLLKKMMDVSRPTCRASILFLKFCLCYWCLP